MGCMKWLNEVIWVGESTIYDLTKQKEHLLLCWHWGS
jgi:hypothetical protein